MSATNPDSLVAELVEVAKQVVRLCEKAGADASEVLVRDGSELTVKVRMGQPELVQEAGSRAVGLRVFEAGPARGDLHLGSAPPLAGELRGREGSSG